MFGDARVIVVGGGISGIAAATRLIENGFTNVTILEAETRLGGRVNTVPFGETTVDLGAHWVHGKKDNPVYELASPLGLLESSHDMDNMHFVLSDGTQLPEDEGLRLFERCSVVLDDLMALKSFEGSVADYLKSRYNELVEDVELTPAQNKAFFNWMSRFECSIEGCDSLVDASAPGLASYKQCEGDSVLCWKSGGFSTLIDIMLNKLPSSKSREIDLSSRTKLDTVVTHIDWSCSGGGAVQVWCSDGSQYTGDHVVVTVSLGVLKQDSIAFKPVLPTTKVNAIKGLEIGTVNKIYLYYEDQWWPENCSGFSFLNTEENTPKTKEVEWNWVNELIGFYTEKNSPRVLCGWLIGEAARSVEKLTDAEVRDTCTTLLRKFVGRKYSVPVPSAIVRSKWFSNPHFRGSYSFRSIQTEEMKTSAADLAEPLLNDKGVQVLLFAGEATHECFYSTVHGAMESGWREADRIINMYTNARKKKKIVIIGAGLAGLGAAKSLCSAGLTNLTILEAQSVAGGRVRSVRVEGHHLELGAQWLHGSYSTLCTLAEENGLLSKEYSNEAQGIYFREGGEKIPLGLVHEVSGIVGQILSECEEFYLTAPMGTSDCANHPTSVGHFLDTEFDKYLATCDDPPHIMNIKRELYQWNIKFQVIDNSCSDLYELCARSWGRYQYCGGHDYVNFSKGFSSLVAWLAGELPRSCELRLDSPVSHILWHSAEPAKACGAPLCRIVCKSGEELAADHVIVTPSIGFLKNNLDFFRPPLPKEYYRGLDSLGFDTVNKIFLIYDKPWWNRELNGIQLVWPSCDSLIPEDMIWTRGLSGFDMVVGCSNVLLGWVGGEEAAMMESVGTVEMVGRHCTYVLRLFTGRSDIPYPKRVVRSQWGRNSYICGGYSHIKKNDLKGTTSDPREALFKPVMAVQDDGGIKKEIPVIFLAGEAISRSHYSTTHGAYGSGKAQASALIKYIMHNI